MVRSMAAATGPASLVQINSGPERMTAAETRPASHNALGMISPTTTKTSSRPVATPADHAAPSSACSRMAEVMTKNKQLMMVLPIKMETNNRGSSLVSASMRSETAG